MAVSVVLGLLGSVVIAALNSTGGPFIVGEARVAAMTAEQSAPDGHSVPAMGTETAGTRQAGGGVSSDTAGALGEPLLLGGPGVLIDIGRPTIVRFDATAGQRLTVLAERRTLTATDNTDLVIRRGGAAVAEGTLINTWPAVSVDLTAPASGRYTVEVKSRAKERGTLLLSLRGATWDRLSLGGPPREVTIAKPGERAFVTFPSPAGRHVTLVARRGSMPKKEYTDLSVYDANGEVETRGAVGIDSDHRTLDFDTTAAGLHTIEINPDTGHTGTITVQMVGAVTARLTPGAPPASITLRRAGERAFVTFRAAEGDRFRLTARRTTLTTAEETYLRVRTPIGLEAVAGALSSERPRAELAFSTSAGTYTIEIDPQGMDTGTLLVKLREIS
ncbi:PPC domain-containing protein [Actinoplanes sp. NPDC049802]|uniref:PPC domain-containing protein n=1 Tax=Actinoplanes sp. NPDC049802 TaxID=3154742 RepID=UPI0033D1150E